MGAVKLVNLLKLLFILILYYLEVIVYEEFNIYDLIIIASNERKESEGICAYSNKTGHGKYSNSS